MSHTIFGNFLDETINVKFKNNIDNELDYFRKNGYVDYRIGCDLCERGDAYGLKTNILKFLNNSNFKLNDLEIDFNDTWYSNDKLELHMMYETSNKKIIKLIYNNYLKINKLNEEKKLTNKINIYSTYTEKVGVVSITSPFRKFPKKENNFSNHISIEELKNIKNVHICSHCCKMFNKKHFIEQNPLKYFWIDFVKNYLHDIIDFESEISMKSFY